MRASWCVQRRRLLLLLPPLVAQRTVQASLLEGAQVEGVARRVLCVAPGESGELRIHGRAALGHQSGVVSQQPPVAVVMVVVAPAPHGRCLRDGALQASAGMLCWGPGV